MWLTYNLFFLVILLSRLQDTISALVSIMDVVVVIIKQIIVLIFYRNGKT
jgi:hypothetical protein